MLSQNFVLEQDPLSLERIRSVLVRLEDTIIFDLIERAQFAHNPRMYIHGAFPELEELGFDGTWLEWFLKEIETFHAKARRYTSPDEYPFTSDLPPPVLKPLIFPKILYPNDINANPSILSFYTRNIVPRITTRATLTLSASKHSNGIVGDDAYEDDGNYGSAATIDVEVLQAISKRVHYGIPPALCSSHEKVAHGYSGKFVSESKFSADPAAFIPHILKPNRQALEALITKPEVERKLLSRLRKKASIYAQEFNPDGDAIANSHANGTAKIDVDGVVELYENYIIPLTKEVEVDYLLHRLDGLTEEEIDRLARQCA
ncbi:chorismate mutase [Lanmaoa asiatica]|nr:chorismate mutase [Lanmaoa asiatica]